MKLLSVLLILIVVAGCNKYEHEDFYPNCELCSFAESIEGVYRGEVTGWPWAAPYEYYTDSATMTVQQIFLNNNSIDDSTTMYFATVHVRDSFNTTPFYDTIQIRSISGEIEVYSGSRSWIRNDSIYLYYYYDNFGFAPFIYYQGILLKQ